MSDTSDQTYDELAGEAGEASKNLNQHIRAMEPEELLALADDLRELLAHPGWQKLNELIGVQRGTIERGAMARLWSHFARGATLRDQAPFIRLGGVIDGLDRPQKIVRHVLKLADVVRGEVENDGEDG